MERKEENSLSMNSFLTFISMNLTGFIYIELSHNFIQFMNITLFLEFLSFIKKKNINWICIPKLELPHLLHSFVCTLHNRNFNRIFFHITMLSILLPVQFILINVFGSWCPLTIKIQLEPDLTLQYRKNLGAERTQEITVEKWIYAAAVVAYQW